MIPTDLTYSEKKELRELVCLAQMGQLENPARYIELSQKHQVFENHANSLLNETTKKIVNPPTQQEIEEFYQLKQKLTAYSIEAMFKSGNMSMDIEEVKDKVLNVIERERYDLIQEKGMKSANILELQKQYN